MNKTLGGRHRPGAVPPRPPTSGQVLRLTFRTEAQQRQREAPWCAEAVVSKASAVEKPHWAWPARLLGGRQLGGFRGFTSNVKVQGRPSAPAQGGGARLRGHGHGNTDRGTVESAGDGAGAKCSWRPWVRGTVCLSRAGTWRKAVSSLEPASGKAPPLSPPSPLLTDSHVFLKLSDQGKGLIEKPRVPRMSQIGIWGLQGP